ncbi:hypothetical protein DUNSADRAFT_6147 [Dunaliella salina]|uniref:Encoded protein n=1 Tax=Dunaliella salina TaxID=3046 RepID=A0ABQ7GNZ2_DUNSA|nr:hypothetical protein DUNSADRAFT_6147 [Dunaliella salina]|eukprot:KAF5836317.1 hypothetical protein DUNSADRAFT_6147 [Dunaliella salina]
MNESSAVSRYVTAAHKRAVGWGITVPVLLRNSSVLSSCDVDDVDAFLVRLANGTNIERSHLNASCVELPPGQAIGYAEQLLNYTTEPAYLRGPPGLQNVAVRW